MFIFISIGFVQFWEREYQGRYGSLRESFCLLYSGPLHSALLGLIFPSILFFLKKKCPFIFKLVLLLPSYVRLKIIVYGGTSGSSLSSTIESSCVNVLKLVDYSKTNKVSRGLKITFFLQTILSICVCDFPHLALVNGISC